jgi:hypothetical protein
MKKMRRKAWSEFKAIEQPAPLNSAAARRAVDEAHIRIAPQNLTLIHSRALAEALATSLRIKFYSL